MRSPLTIGVALGNVPLQDQVCEILALEARLEVRACRTDAELEMLLAGHLLDGVVLGPRLVGLERRVVPAIAQTGVRGVLLVPPQTVEAHRTRFAELAPTLRVLPDTVSIGTIRAALSAGPDGARPQAGGRIESERKPVSASFDPDAAGAHGRSTRGRLVTLTGCDGAGTSTTSVNVGYASGVVRDVVVVDLDLLGPSLVPMVDADPSLGLAGILRAEQSGVTFLEQALNEHLQPLGNPARSPRARLLGGLPLDGSTHTVTPDLVVRLLEALRRRVDLVLVDVGRVLPATERIGAAQRAALLAADGILVVSGGDRLSVKRTQDYVARLVGMPAHPDPARLALVLTRYDGRVMEAPTEIAASLGLPLAACVPVDARALDASGTALPLVARGSHPAAVALIDLADALGAPDWPPLPVRSQPAWRRLVALATGKGRAVRRYGATRVAMLAGQGGRGGMRSSRATKRRTSEVG